MARVKKGLNAHKRHKKEKNTGEYPNQSTRHDYPTVILIKIITT